MQWTPYDVKIMEHRQQIEHANRIGHLEIVTDQNQRGRAAEPDVIVQSRVERLIQTPAMLVHLRPTNPHV